MRRYFEIWTGVSLIKSMVVFSIVGCLLSFGFDLIDDGSINRLVRRHVERSVSGALTGVVLFFVMRLLIPKKHSNESND